ncbi:hypothetical protein HDU98_003534 [Podochytrium sp. JEL0797]|nr:hypothetical protein HDU98_003534 [Podochytrium sp. JEL0797]
MIAAAGFEMDDFIHAEETSCDSTFGYSALEYPAVGAPPPLEGLGFAPAEYCEYDELLRFAALFPADCLAPPADSYEFNYYPSPFPSRTPSLQSPFSSMYSQDTTPALDVCLPLSIVAPSPFFDAGDSLTSLTPGDLYAHPSQSYQQYRTDNWQQFPACASPTALFDSPEKTSPFKRPLLLRDFKKSPSPIAHSLLDDASDSDVASPTPTLTRAPSSTAARSKSESKTPPSPVYSPRKTSPTHKRSSSAASGDRPAKKRHILHDSETEVLNKCFEKHPFLHTTQALELSERLGMTVNQVRIWFQNKRAYAKRQLNKNQACEDE